MSREYHVRRRIGELKESIKLTQRAIQELEWFLDLKIDDEPEI